MTTKRGKLIALGLALVLVGALAFFVFSSPQNGVSAYSTDKRVKIFNAQYLKGTNIDYTFIPPSRRIKYTLESLLGKVHIRSFPWEPVKPVRLFGDDLGPALVVYGCIEVGDRRLQLVTEQGQAFPLLISAGYSFFLPPKARFFVWNYTLTNTTYHLRLTGESNDLAVIRIPQEPND